MGSSATAVVGGLVAANEWLRIQRRLSKEELLELAVEAEAGNHPDNVAPALLGGLVATTSMDGKINAIRTPFPDALKAVIFTPSFPMDTVAGRKLLPASYSKADVTFNTGRVALLLTALQTGRYELIGEAMQDRLHQPYRQALFPAMPEIIDAANAAGAHGASLSGGGSSLIALASSRFHEVLRAMQNAAHEAGVEGTGMVLRADQHGARVLQTSRSRIRKEVSARHGDQFYWSPAKPGAGEKNIGIPKFRHGCCRRLRAHFYVVWNACPLSGARSRAEPARYRCACGGVLDVETEFRILSQMVSRGHAFDTETEALMLVLRGVSCLISAPPHSLSGPPIPMSYCRIVVVSGATAS